MHSKSQQQFLRRRVEEDKLDILMLQETKSIELLARKTIQKCWRPLDAIAIDAQGYSCGMVLAWNQTTIQLETYWKTKRDITTKFHYIGTETR